MNTEHIRFSDEMYIIEEPSRFSDEIFSTDFGRVLCFSPEKPMYFAFRLISDKISMVSGPNILLSTDWSAFPTAVAVILSFASYVRISFSCPAPSFTCPKMVAPCPTIAFVMVFLHLPSPLALRSASVKHTHPWKLTFSFWKTNLTSNKWISMLNGMWSYPNQFTDIYENIVKKLSTVLLSNGWIKIRLCKLRIYSML